MTANGAAGRARLCQRAALGRPCPTPEIVLDRYTRGDDLAESFSMGTPYLNWKQIVLGDPLCAPYGNQAVTTPR